MRLALLLTLAAGAMLAAGALLAARPARVVAPAVAVAVLGVALGDALAGPRAADFHTGRSVPGPLCLGHPAAVTIGLRWDPRGRAAARDLWWTDHAPPELCRQAPAGRGRIHPGAVFTATYPVLPERRGVAAWAGPRFTIASPLGLWWTRLDAAIHLERTVYPATARLPAGRGLAMRAGRPPTGEHGLEFDGVRPYLAGEDAKRIDWRATARWDEPVIRRLRPERGRRIVLVVDAGRRGAQRLLGETSPGLTRLDLLCDAAMAVARTALGAGDAVGVMLLRGASRTLLPPRQGGAALEPLSRMLAEASAAGGDADIAGAIASLLAIPCEAVFWFGEGPTAREAAPLLRYLPALGRRRRLAFLEVGAPPPPDPTAALRTVIEQAAEERRAVLRALARHGVAGHDAPPERAAATAVATYLRWAQRGAAL